MKTRSRSLLSVVALALLTTSCLNDPVKPETTGPDPLELFAFEAVSANDRPLPAFIDADGSTQSGRQLTRASILLLSPDSLRLILTTRHVAENGDAGAAVSDTLWALMRSQDSTLALVPLGTHPLLLSELRLSGSDQSIVLTVEQPLPSSDGAAGNHPVELRFQRTGFSGTDQH